MADVPPDEGEEDDMEDGVFPYLKADHHLMKEVHEAMGQQLTKQNERATLALRDKNEEYKKLHKHREEIGVTLYGAQQQLAKLQLQLETLHDKFATVHQQRAEDDEQLKQVQKSYDGKRKEADDANKRMQKSQDELNQLNVTLRQVEEYNEQMKKEIQVTRRATYKAEDHIKGVEKTKHKQDLLIDRMNEEVKNMTEQKALLDAQLTAQKQETEAAVATLREATREMEAIDFEKKQLLQQWRSSLVGMQRRDEALRDIQTAMSEQMENEMAVENEVRGLQNSIRREQEKHEQLSSLKDRNDKESAHLNGSMKQIKEDREKLLDNFNMLKKAMDIATDETTKHKSSLTDAEREMGVMEKNIQTVSRNATALVAKIEEQVSDQTTSDRASQNSKKRLGKIREEIEQKEVETENLHNEIARVTVDSLNTKAHNQMLKDRHKQLSEDLGEREKLIEQYEQEIRKRHHQIEKKQLYVDRLNGEYDAKRTKLESEAGEADVAGPQEAKVKHTKKAIADMTKECADMQKDWITKQTQLLSMSTDTDRQRSHVNDQKNRRIVLEQKKLRIEGQLEAQKKEIKSLDNSMKHLRFDMGRMNIAVVKNDNKSEELANNNTNLETEFVQKLRELESDCSRMEGAIAGVKDETQGMSDDVMEAERQVMLWERKIALEKEMQEALDPNVGQAESSAMQKEIHRMELRLEQLKRRQEQMIAEMTRVIHKRDAIAMKHEPKAKKSKQASSTANLKRQLQSLKNNLRLCTQASADAEQKITQRESENAHLQQELEQMGDQIRQHEMEVEHLRQDVQVKTVEKQQNLAAMLKQQRSGTRFKEFAMGTGPGPAPNARNQCNEQRALSDKTSEIVRVLHDAYPALEGVWSQFYEWLAVPAAGVED